MTRQISDREILERLGPGGLVEESRQRGLRFASERPKQTGWAPCHAFDRNDNTPSAALCLEHGEALGRYADQGGGERSLSFFDLLSSLAPGEFSDWRAARDYLLGKVGDGQPTPRTNGSAKPKTPPVDLMEQVEPMHDEVERYSALATWAKAKGLNIDAIERAGAIACRWPRNSASAQTCLAFPAKDRQQVCAALLYCIDGKAFPAAGSLAARKTHLLKGSRDGLVIVGDKTDFATSHTAWLCEGITDAIALAANLPVGHIACANVCGAKSCPLDAAEMLQEKAVYICRDADKPGQAGAKIVADKLAGKVLEVRVIKLPYDISENKGKDLRDFFAEGHTVDELLTIAKDTPEWVAEDERLSPAETLTQFLEGRGVDQPAGPAFTNYKVVAASDDNGKPIEKPMPLTMAEIRTQQAALLGTWPRRVGRVLFVPHDAEGISWLQSPDALFGWIASQLGNTNWGRLQGCISKAEFFAELQRDGYAHEAVEFLPHFPPIPRHYYASAELKPGDGEALRSLLSRFSPATSIDADLLLAAFATPLWGGPPGARPAFIFTADSGRGVGKSKSASMIPLLFGGAIEVDQKEDMAAVKTRMLSNEGLTKRIAFLDNVKSLRFSWAELESLVTTMHISGKRLFAGEGARKNLFTWLITLNGASLSKDLAQRAVLIKLSRPTYIGNWEEETSKFIVENRNAIIADLQAFFEQPCEPLAKHSRWAAWEQAILARLAEPEEVQTVIAERQAVADVEAEECGIIEDFFADRLLDLGYDIVEHRVFIPTEIACRWFNRATGESKGTTAVTRMMNQLVTEQHIKRISTSSSRSHGRGMIWASPDFNPSETLRTDIADRIDAKKRYNEWSY